MRLHHLKDEEVVLVDEPVIMQPAFEARMALPDQWRPDVMSFGQGRRARGCVIAAVRPNAANLSICRPEVLPIPTTGSVSAVVGRLITHSRLLRIMGKL